MDLDQLQSVRDRERQTDKLQQLRDSFYEEATAYVRDLREERDRAAERADDPFDAPEVNRLTDQIRTAEQTIESIYEKRVGKLVKAATFAAADLPAEADGMTAEEEDLFETLVAEIQANRQRVLDRLTGDVDGGATDPDPGSVAPDGPGTTSEPEDASGSTPTANSSDDGIETPDRVPPDVGEEEPTTGDDSRMSAADVMQGGDDAPPAPGADPDDDPSGDGQSADSPSEAAEADEESVDEDTVREDGGAAVDRELVRITADVGAIFGVDEREYELAEDDVVSLPAENAQPLVDRDAAERL